MRLTHLRRLEAAELVLRTNRDGCDLCRDWPTMTYAGADDLAFALRYYNPTHGHMAEPRLAEEVPTPCPACGRERPVSIWAFAPAAEDGKPDATRVGESVYSHIERRLSLAEQIVKSRRCSTCRTWPANRITHENDWMTDREPDPTPEQCPDCGWAPTTIVLHYTGDWRGGQWHPAPGFEVPTDAES